MNNLTQLMPAITGALCLTGLTTLLHYTTNPQNIPQETRAHHVIKAAILLKKQGSYIVKGKNSSDENPEMLALTKHGSFHTRISAKSARYNVGHGY